MPNPVNLPHLPQLDDLPSPKTQLHFIYKPKDARKIQGLDPVFTVGARISKQGHHPHQETRYMHHIMP
jgi:hypothetical protein